MPQIHSCNESALRLLTAVCHGTSRSQTKERAGGAGLPAHHSTATSASDGLTPRPSHTSPTAVPPKPQTTWHASSASLLLAQQARLTLLWNAWRVRWARFRPQCKNQYRTPKLGRSRETPTNQKQAKKHFKTKSQSREHTCMQPSAGVRGWGHWARGRKQVLVDPSRARTD